MHTTPHQPGPFQRSVLVISDIRLYREGVCRLLAEERFAARSACGEPGPILDEIAVRPRGVVLLDAATPGSLSLARGIRLRAPETRVIVLTVSDVRAELLAFAEAGIAGYVTRDGSASDLVAAIECARKDEALCSPRAAAALLARVAVLSTVPPADNPRLTARESEILALLEAGLSNKQIGAQLFIGVPTVKTHVHNILRKLGATRRGEAAALARCSV
jgi:DNA-binding NarL/FixJ family response regulator